MDEGSDGSLLLEETRSTTGAADQRSVVAGTLLGNGFDQRSYRCGLGAFKEDRQRDHQVLPRRKVFEPKPFDPRYPALEQGVMRRDPSDVIKVGDLY